MMRDVQTDEISRRPLAGMRGWLISSGMGGMDVQTRGVAEALGLDYEMKRVEPRGSGGSARPGRRWRRRSASGSRARNLRHPWPDIAISLGRGGVPYMRALRRRAGSATFTVVMQDPKTGLGTADMIWVPEHDRLRGANVFTTLTAPHSFTAKRLAELRRTMPPAIAALPRPRVSVILGGKNAVYKFRDEDDERLARSFARSGRLGVSFLITPSRRTHDRLRRVVEEATRAFPRIFWDGQGPNPYGDFLAHGDLFVVTADSVNMVGEACATGKPVLVFTPGGGSAKFRRFHAAFKRAEPRGRCPMRSTPSRNGAMRRCSPTTRSRARSSGAGLRADAESRGRVRMPAGNSAAVGDQRLGAPALSDIPDGLLRAGGTLSVRPLTFARGLWLPVEMALIYLGVPFLVERPGARLPGARLHRAAAVLAIVLLLLLIDPTFSLKRELGRGCSAATSPRSSPYSRRRRRRRLLGHAHHSDWFLDSRAIARHLLDHHAALPLMSVPRRSSSIARSSSTATARFRARLVARNPINACCSASGTCLGTELAVVGTMATGRCLRSATRDTLVLGRYLEHTLWGSLVFTVGLGRFFFTGFLR